MFTIDEIAQVFQLEHPPNIARQMAESFLKGLAATDRISSERAPKKALGGIPPASLSYKNLPSVTYSEDLLLLVSLVSTSAHEKVLALKGASGSFDEEARVDWERRRSSLATRPDIREWLSRIHADK